MLATDMPARRKILDSQGREWPNLDKCNRDGPSLVMQGLATVVRIAQQDKNQRLALSAGQWLVQYGESIIARQREQKAIELKRIEALPTASGGEREAILNDLRGLYAKALGSSPLVVEAQPDPSDQT